MTVLLDARIWTTHARPHDCPDCDGQGRDTAEIPGGVWNSWVGTWEPAERDNGPCETCNGTGEVIVAACDRCNLPSEDNHPEILRELGECSCSEEAMLDWHEQKEAPNAHH